MGSNRERMAQARREVPDDESLARGLGVVLEPESADPVALLDRSIHLRMSTFPLEIVQCRLSSGDVVEVVCKYSDDQDFRSSSYRGGVRYEAAVYRDILQRCGLPLPGFRGTYMDAMTGRTWLVLDYLNGAEKSGETPNGLVYAAEWLGRFHCVNAGKEASHSVLRVYDEEYFIGWADRTIEFARVEISRAPWLEDMAMAYRKRVPELFRQPLTVIHGEYYYKNVLVSDGVAYPLDWETAAVGPGAVDIAALTECWREETVSQCLARYCATRWPEGAPDDFSEVLDIARVYWLFRWPGEVEHKADKRLQKRLPQLAEIARRWGVINDPVT